MPMTIADMLLIGGHPALDLANTVDDRRGRMKPDRLQSSRDFLVLANRIGFIADEQIDPLERETQTGILFGLASMKTLRETVHRIFVEESIGTVAEPAQIWALEFAAKKARTSQRLMYADGVWQWRKQPETFSDVIGLFALSAADLLTSIGQRRPVRECKREDCGWLFLDTSKNGKRVWCSETRCGTQSRVRRFRAT
jgi:predicted RNA-binding Zn ribbon-like protein